MSAQQRIVSYPLWNTARFHMDAWNNGITPSTKSYGLKWTALTSATLSYTVIAEVWPSWADLYLNGTDVKQFDFRAGGGTITETIDVMSLLTQGLNSFTFKASKTSWVGFGDYIITANLILDGIFEDPTTPNWWEQLPTWWPYAAGAGIILFGVWYSRRRRTQYERIPVRAEAY